MRRLIFCFDGSWSKLAAGDNPTNVVLLAEGITTTDHHGIPQIVYYDEGVGTRDDEIWRGGVFGKGVVDNIHDAYRFLVFNYQAGDEIFVFGFSRGAFTARSFIGFVRCAGILNVNDARQIRDAWKLYQANAHRIDDEPEPVRQFRAAYCPGICIDQADRDWRLHNIKGFDPTTTELLRVRYCGVWDTVGSLGWRVVRATFVRNPSTDYNQFDTDLSMTVESARHAVSVDERGVHFLPTLWRNVRQLNEQRGASYYADDAPYQQRWFPGDHGSVGGGGPIRGLSNATLQWVVAGAVQCGLEVRLGDRSQLRDIRYDQRAPLHNTPITGSWAKFVHSITSRLFVTNRSGPTEVTEVSASALRRWFTPGDQLPERREYRPKPLKHVADAIEQLRSTYVPVETKADGAGFTSYTVKLGDTLSKIARDVLHDMPRYPEIFALNRDQLDSPGDIFPGQVLRLPPASPIPEPAASTASPGSVAASVPPAPH